MIFDFQHRKGRTYKISENFKTRESDKFERLSATETRLRCTCSVQKTFLPFPPFVAVPLEIVGKITGWLRVLYRINANETRELSNCNSLPSPLPLHPLALSRGNGKRVWPGLHFARECRIGAGTASFARLCAKY